MYLRNGLVFRGAEPTLDEWLIDFFTEIFSLCNCLWSLILGCRWCESLLFRKRKGFFFLPLYYTIALKWLWERKVIYSFRRLSEDGVLFPVLISTWNFAGTEVEGAPQLAGSTFWGQQDSAFPRTWTGLQVCIFLFPQESLPPIEKSLIAGQLAAIAQSPLQSVCACYCSVLCIPLTGDHTTSAFFCCSLWANNWKLK